MTLTIELTTREEATLERLARHEGIDLAAYAKRVLTENLPLGDTVGDDAADFGGKTLYEEFGHLFGTVTEGPNDVAANPHKYMSGFGTTGSGGQCS